MKVWILTDESNDSGGDPTDNNYDLEDLAPEALAEADEDCKRFQTENASDLALAYELYEPHVDAPTPQCSAGHDLWLTRNRHGVGFWDRGLGAVGKRLTDAAHKFGECDMYVGDGKIYL